MESRVFDVGLSGSPYQNLSDVVWEDLEPGDTVRIHYREEPYNERILIDARGTEDLPITIEGIPGPNGELPVLDAANATTDTQFQDFNSGWRQDLGGSIFVGSKNAYPDESEQPAHIVIRGLELTGSGQGNSFSDAFGEVHNNSGTSAIYIKGGEGIVIENNYIHSNGNGIFSNSNHMHETVEGLVVRGNIFEDNGVEGSHRYHHVYTEGIDTLIENNTFGKKIDGDLGSLLKMRDVGLEVTGNSFASTVGHFIDLSNVESDHFIATGLHKSEKFLHENFVHNNTIDAASGSIFFGGDSFGKDQGSGLGLGVYRETLHFYENEVNYHSDRSDLWRSSLFDSPSTDQTIILTDNDIEGGSATQNAVPTILGILSGSSDANVVFEGVDYVDPDFSKYTDEGVGNGYFSGWETNVVGQEDDSPSAPSDPDEDEVDPDNGQEVPAPDPSDDPVVPTEPEEDPSKDPSPGETDGNTFEGTHDNDLFVGSAADEKIHGSFGDDTLNGKGGSDQVDGGEGDDRLLGGGGNDHLIGENGNDVLEGESGQDVLEGSAGDDVLRGGLGDDVLRGGDGDDVVYGDQGNDVLEGGSGSDFLNGGTGADTFVFVTVPLDGSLDKIHGFRTSEGDSIDLSGMFEGIDVNKDNYQEFVKFSTSGGYHTTVSVRTDADADQFVDLVELRWISLTDLPQDLLIL